MECKSLGTLTRFQLKPLGHATFCNQYPSVTSPPVFWFASVTTGNSDLKEEGDVGDAILLNDTSAARAETNVITNH